ncbi:MAG TPA: hypothetical protein VKR23_15515 [Gaiellaceae bacterium]|nr:hypothetical protein [Gaiellaceae bacterium]
MPRQPRDTRPGIFHVYTHAVWHRALYRDDVDRLEFLRHLARVSDGWECLAFCLMESHYHLIVEVGDGVLPTVMRSLNLAYALAYNARHSLRGHVQFDRYGSRRVLTDDALVTAYGYVANNPVRAGLCRAASDWPWSNFAGTVGLRPKDSFVADKRILECFASPTVDAKASLRWHVEKA